MLFWVHSDQGGLDALHYGEIGRRIDHVRAGLDGLGIEKGYAVGIISNNRPEWAILAFATYGRNARYIPIYEKDLVSTWKYIIQDSQLKFLLVSTPAIYEKGFSNPFGNCCLMSSSTKESTRQSLN
ncbi:MAG: AMP-binding protein [Desulfobacteraceae bacterium]|nr:AMP-binding protein [Desulfobacteraceae bacterium]